MTSELVLKITHLHLRCVPLKKKQKKNLTAKLAFREFNAETYTLVKLK